MSAENPTFIPPCELDECPRLGEVGEINSRLCKTIANTLIGAGGASFVEDNPCATEALFALGEAQGDPTADEIMAKLGMTVVHDVPPGFFD